MPPKDGHIGIQDILESLANNDLRFEVMLSALLEVLKTKKLPDGQPLITDQEFMEKVNEVQKKIMSDLAIAKPKSSIIHPGSLQ